VCECQLPEMLMQLYKQAKGGLGWSSHARPMNRSNFVFITQLAEELLELRGIYPEIDSYIACMFA
jgi:hypothetical protein